MALIHRATLSSGKLELRQLHAPGQSWFTDRGPLETVGAHRWDDPAGLDGPAGLAAVRA